MSVRSEADCQELKESYLGKPYMVEVDGQVRPVRTQDMVLLCVDGVWGYYLHPLVGWKPVVEGAKP